MAFITSSCEENSESKSTKRCISKPVDQITSSNLNNSSNSNSNSNPILNPNPSQNTVANSYSYRMFSTLFGSNIINFISLPINFFYKNVIDLIKFTWSLIGFDFDRNTDPLKDVLDFIEKFKATYGDKHPNFYVGSYNKAVAEAKKDLKFLLIYLHNNLHEDTDNFCKEVLVHSDLINFIHNNNLLFWSCSINSNEGYSVSKFISQKKYPFLALISLKFNKMVVLQKFQGKTTVELLIRKLQSTIEKNEPHIKASRLKRQQMTMDQQIRLQQDQDYEESLRADQEKERKRKEERDRKEREEQERKNKEHQEFINTQKLIDLKKTLIKYINDEPDLNTSDTIKLLVKLPNGKRLERRFRKETSIDQLFYFVFCNEESPLKFSIKTNFPTRELPCLSPSIETKSVTCSLENNRIPSLEEFGLKNCEVLYVHDIEA